MSTSRMTPTIVSCYYMLGQSKHFVEEYANWIRNFLVYVNTPIVMFSDGEAYDYMIHIRRLANLENTFCIIRKPLSELEFSTPEWVETWKQHVEKSSYKHLHNQELYRIWANKSFFVREAIEKNPFQSEHFVWCDAGCWRDPRIARFYGRDWPCIESLDKGRLTVLAMVDMMPFFEQLENPAIQTLDDLVTTIHTDNVLTMGGTILAGDRTAWLKWIPAFQNTLQAFVRNELFAGDDQSVIASTILWLAKTDMDACPSIINAPLGDGFVEKDGVRMGDRWFAFQIILSQEFKHRIK
jgi:hypothetical protein